MSAVKIKRLENRLRQLNREMQRMSVKFNLDPNVTRQIRYDVLAHARRSTPHKELRDYARARKDMLRCQTARPPPMRRMHATPRYNASLNYVSPFAIPWYIQQRNNTNFYPNF